MKLDSEEGFVILNVEEGKKPLVIPPKGESDVVKVVLKAPAEAAKKAVEKVRTGTFTYGRPLKK